MHRIENLLRAISDAERVARTSIAEAAEEGSLDEVCVIVEVARHLADLRSKYARNDRADTSNPSPAALTPSRCGDGEGSSKPADQKDRASEYFRDGDELIRVGKSRRDNGTYEHRAAKSVVDAMVRVFSERAANPGRISADDIVRSLPAPAGRPIPDYQAYAVLGWLKWAGLINQNGRRGYTVPRPASFSAAVGSAWLALRQK